MKQLKINAPFTFVKWAVFALLPQMAWGAWTPPYRDNEWQSASVNALGGTGQLAQNPSDQVFYDASLSAVPRKQGFQLQWTSLNVMFSRDLSNTVGDLQAFATSGTQDSNTESTRTLSTVKKLFGRKLSGGFTVTSMATRAGGLSFIPHINVLTETGLRVPSYPQARIYLDGNAGIMVNYAREMNKEFQVGVTLKPMVRIYESFEKSLSDLVPQGTLGNSSTTASGTEQNQDLKPKYGVIAPFDLGLGYTGLPKTRIYGQLANLGPRRAILNLSDAPVSCYLSRINVGVTNKILESGPHSIQVGTELQDIAGLSQNSGLWYRWQWAGQYEFKPGSRAQTLFAVHTGFQSGYPSIGLHLDLVLAKIEAALHTKETGYFVGQAPERRYSFRLYSQMSF